MLDVFVLRTTDNSEFIDAIIDSGTRCRVIDVETPTITEEVIIRTAKQSLTKFFYIVRHNSKIDLDFSFAPNALDTNYVHVYRDDDSVRIYPREMCKKYPARYTDDQLAFGNMPMKLIDTGEAILPNYPIVFMSYDEEYADANFIKLQERFPRIQRVHGVKGIVTAHQCAARLAAKTNAAMFFVVDADADVVSTFDFSYVPQVYDMHSMHVWHSKNPVNNLEYGYGGIKLFPTQIVIDLPHGTGIDFSTTAIGSVKVIAEISNYTRFNTTEFSAWRAGFRESVKLCRSAMSGDVTAQHTLDHWCTVATDALFSESARAGAISGRQYTQHHIGDIAALSLINDYDWLLSEFNNQQYLPK